MISEQDTARIQQEIGMLALAAVRLDLDGFLEATDQVGSPQALAAGIAPAVVTGAAEWSVLAMLLKPFREEAVRRVAQIRAELAEHDDDLVSREAACPACGERFVDRLSINEDGSVICATCGKRYFLPGEGASHA